MEHDKLVCIRRWKDIQLSDIIYRWMFDNHSCLDYF